MLQVETAQGEVPQDEGDYVVLLHGMARTSRSMAKIAEKLQEEGFSVLNLDYPSTGVDIETISTQYLAEAVEKGCPDRGRKIHFVTHSLGGIVVRLYMKDAKPENAGRVVMIAPPNKGSEVADILKRFFLYKWIFGPSGQVLGTGLDSVPSQLGAVDYEVGVIAGVKSINPINSFLIPGRDDGKVSVERTKIEGMKDFIEVDHSHTFIMKSSEVADQTSYFLLNGRFRHTTLIPS